jgi:acid stress-induced BolA-like protein IbaG/YrbA
MALKNKRRMKQKQTLKERLAALLTAPESVVKHAVLDVWKNRYGSLKGFLISPTFFGMPQLDRQNMVWDYLDARLSEEDRSRILSLLTVTPQEMEE